MQRGTSRTAGLAAAILVALGSSGMVVAQGRPDDSDGAQRAATLLEEGRVIEARSILLTLRKTETDIDRRERVLQLLAAAERRLESMGRVEISLQRAELAVSQGDLRTADQQANAARRADNATPEQKKRASALLDRSAKLRDELAPMVGPALNQAVADFLAGRYPEAKAGFGSVSRSGVRLTQAQTAQLNRHQERILELERQQKKTFDLDYVPLGVLRSAHEAPPAEVIATTAVVAADEPEPASMGAMSEAGQDGDAAPPAPGTDRFKEAAQADANRLLGEAEAAFAAGRYDEAVAKFNEVADLYSTVLDAPAIAAARDRALEARARGAGAAAAAGGGAELLQQVGNQRTLMREEASVVYDNLVDRSRTALAAGDTGEARNLAAQARLSWNSAFANALFTEEEYRAKSGELDQLLRSIDSAEDSIRVKEIDSRSKAIEQEALTASQREERERLKKINENLDRLRALQAEQKYEEALQVTEQVLFLDPTNPAALLMKDIIQDVIWYRDWERLQREKSGSYFKESLEVQRGMIAPDRVMEFPPDWPEISFRRGEIESFVESDADRRVLASLETKRIPASFQENTLADVIQFIATVTNLNIDPDWESLTDIGVEKETPVTLSLQEVPVRVVLDRVLQKVSRDEFSKAGWAVNDGVLVVASDQRLRRNTFIVLYDVRDLLYQIPNFTNVPQLDLEQVLSQTGAGGGGGGGGGGVIEEFEPEIEGLTEQELLDRLTEIITSNIDPDGWKDNGGDTGALEELNGNLIITNTSKNHRSINNLLKQLREVRSVQINVEARFLSVAQDFFERIGFDLDIYLNAQNNQYRDAIAQQTAFGAGTLSNGNVGLLPGQLVGLTGAGGGSAGVIPGSTSAPTGYRIPTPPAAGQPPTYTFAPNPFQVTNPESVSIIPIQQNSLGINDTLISGSRFASQILGAGGLVNPALGIAGTFLDDIQVDFLIEATQADRRNVVLNAPRLTFTNGRAANISVVTQSAFISGLTPIVGASSVAFQPTIGVSSVGFTLALRGVVSADRRYVTLTVQTGLTTNAGPPVPFEVPAAVAGTGGTDGSGTVTAEFSIPVLAVTQINTGITVPDQGTILLGGQRMVTELEVETGVPVLSKIPILNRFFTNRSMSKEESTLLILLKPTIIIQNEEEERNFPGLLDKLNSTFR